MTRSTSRPPARSAQLRAVASQRAKAPTWVLTRARAESVEWRSAFSGRGLATRLLPCIARRRRALRPWPKAPSSAGVGDLSVYVFVTSPYVARLLPKRRLEARGVRVAALEPRCVEVLRERGLPVLVSARGGTVALAEALARHLHGRLAPGPVTIVYPSSDVGAKEPEQQRSRRMLAPLGRLLTPVAYETVRPPGLVASVKALPAGPLGLVFASPSAVHNFLVARRGAGVRPMVRAVVCLGASTAQAWDEGRPAGWPTALRASSTDEVLALCQKERRP
jgi:uroporphyrinogen-III synthase